MYLANDRYADMVDMEIMKVKKAMDEANMKLVNQHKKQNKSKKMIILKSKNKARRKSKSRRKRKSKSRKKEKANQEKLEKNLNRENLRIHQSKKYKKIFNQQ